MKKYESGICANCGADYGLHQSLSNCCPLYGREESNPNKPQQWESTVFEDSGMKALHDSAPDLLEALQEVIRHGLNENIDGYETTLKTVWSAINKAQGI